MIRTSRSSLEEKCGVKLDAGARHLAMDCRTRRVVSEVGRHGKNNVRKTLMFAEGMRWMRKRAGGSRGKRTCMWLDGIFLGVKATTGEGIEANGRGVWLTRKVNDGNATT